MTTKTNVSPIYWNILLPLAALKLIVHFLTNTNYGLHRDEYLYLTESEHLAWGYMEVPPMIALIGKIARMTMGDTVFAARFFPALIGAISIILIGIMTRDLGGKKYAQLLAGTAFLLSPAYLGSNNLFQPVSFNQFCWLLSAFWVVKIIRYESPKFWYYLGITAGIAFLTKYSIAFFFIGLIGGFLLTTHRKVFLTKSPYIALGIAFLIAFPNLYWQFQYDFPVMRHMQDLAASQLVHMSTADFLIPQFTFHFAGTIIWLSGLYFFFRSTKYRVLAWAFVIVLLLLLFLSGKNYYTIGAYAMLFAGGGVLLEKYLQEKIGRLIPVILILNLPIIPYALPVFSVEKMVSYFAWMRETTGLTSPLRWEDGSIHEITQDYADMHGWEELPTKVAKIYHQLSPEQKEKCMILGGNYGQAGVLNFYRKKYNLPETYSFNSSFVMWVPEDFDIEYQIEIDDNRDMESSYFHQKTLVDSITHVYARDPGYIFFKAKPKMDLRPLWKELVQERKTAAGY